MSNFIKVTEAVSGKQLMIPMSNIDYIEDGLVWLRDGDSVQVVDTIKTIEDGLLRDEFAKHALTSLVSKYKDEDYIAIQSLLYANAMTEERLRWK